MQAARKKFTFNLQLTKDITSYLRIKTLVTSNVAHMYQGGCR